jgi:hypothetical protein
MKRYFGYTLTVLLAAVFSGCYYDVAEELYPSACDTSNVTYSGKVLPVIQGSCVSCHSGSSPSANVNLDGYNNTMTYVNNGRLMGAIMHSAGFAPMPQGGNKLSECTISILQKWIANGAPNN